MNRKLKFPLIIALALLALTPLVMGASSDSSGGGCTPATSRTGLPPANPPKIVTRSNGMTNEAWNIYRREQLENTPGDVKYFYAISAYDNKYMYSMVDGKVTSSGKRLTPLTTNGAGYNVSMPDGNDMSTSEVEQDDTTYGTSVDYLYWFDPKGNYYQVYPTGGWLFVVRSTPMAIPQGATVIQMEPTIPAGK